MVSCSSVRFAVVDAVRPRTSVTVAVNVAGALCLSAGGNANGNAIAGHGCATLLRFASVPRDFTYSVPSLFVARRTTCTGASTPSSSKVTFAVTVVPGYAGDGVIAITTFLGAAFGLTVQLIVDGGPTLPDRSVAVARIVYVIPASGASAPTNRYENGAAVEVVRNVSVVPSTRTYWTDATS